MSNMNALNAQLPPAMAWLQGQRYPGNLKWPAQYRASLNPPSLSSIGQLAEAQAQANNAAMAQQTPAAPQQVQHHVPAQSQPWVREQVYWPTPYFPQHPNLGRQVRDYVRNFTIANSGSTSTQTVQIDIPGCIYALSGAIIRSDGSGFPVGWKSLDAVSVQFVYNNGEQLQTLAGLGSAILGSAERPRMLGGPAWTFDRGAQITCTLTSNLANLQISVACWVMEIRGPTNISSLG